MVKDDESLEKKVEKSTIRHILDYSSQFPSRFGTFITNHPKNVKEYFLPTAYSAAIIMGFKIPVEMEMMDFTIAENVILNAKLCALFQFAYGPYLIEAAGKPMFKKLDDYFGHLTQRSKDFVRLSSGFVAGFLAKSLGYEAFSDKAFDEYWGAALAVGFGAAIINDLLPHFQRRKTLKYSALAFATAGVIYGYGIKLNKTNNEKLERLEQNVILYDASTDTKIDSSLDSQTILYNVGNDVKIPQRVLQKVTLYEVPAGSKIKAEGSTLEVTIFDESPEKISVDTTLYNSDTTVDDGFTLDNLKVYRG